MVEILTVLVYIRIHHALLACARVYARKYDGLLAVMMKLHEFTPADAIADERSIVIRLDVGSLEVDTIQSSDDDVVNNDHIISYCCISIACLHVLRGDRVMIYAQRDSTRRRLHCYLRGLE